MGANDTSSDGPFPLIEPCADLAGFFHETLRSALASRRVDAPVHTERYLVDLLADLGHDETVLARSLVELELDGQELGGEAKLERMRSLGDQALSISGLFDAHLERHGLSRSYVVAVGRRAYQRASHLASASRRGHHRACAPVFFDLGAHFATYADVLDDVREQTALGTRDDVLSLYERYTKTGSAQLLTKLTDRGVLPIAPEQPVKA